MNTRVKNGINSLKTNGVRYTFILFCRKTGFLFRHFIQRNYYDELEDRNEVYRKIYCNDQKKAIIRMLWWNFKALFKVQYSEKNGKVIIKEKNKSLPEELSRENLNMGFFLGGGFGEYIFFANYLYKLYQKFGMNAIHTDLYLNSGLNYVSVLFRDDELVQKAFLGCPKDGIVKRYDIFINLSRYPEVRYINYERVAGLQSELLEYIQLVEQFKIENRRFFIGGADYDGHGTILAMIGGQSRLQQPDVYQYLGITNEYEYKIPVRENEKVFLRKTGLLNKSFITVHRGCDLNYPRHVKMWESQNYEKVIHLIHREYPELVIVQYGASHDRCDLIRGVDIDLTGRTTMEEVKILLKKSLIHIDSDGGMIHLRHAIHGGPSVAMYGPNAEEFFGYSENENITGQGCIDTCEWLTNDWMLNCARGYKIPPCMESITPEMVMERIRKIYRQLSDQMGN